MRNNILIVIIFGVLLTGYGMVSYFQKTAVPIPDITYTSGSSNSDYKLPKYNEDKSITYKKSYNDLGDELLYARIVIHKATAQKTICLIKDKHSLIQIVREFDKLKSTMPQEEHKLDRTKIVPYVVTIWREGTSVSYVIDQFDTVFYYREAPTSPLRPMPEKLVKLLGFNSESFSSDKHS